MEIALETLDWTAVGAIATVLMVIIYSLILYYIYKQMKLQTSQLKSQNDSQLLYLLNQLERDFEDLNKLMLSDKLFREGYTPGGGDDEYAKKYIFYELYYGYLERSYAFLNSEINPSRNEPMVKRYWNLFLPTIRWMSRYEMFHQVHKYAKAMEEFDSEFINLVDKIIDEEKNSPTKWVTDQRSPQK